jgi:DNA-directed RNA polymerase I, II, and III subunit RPABC4
VYYDHPATKRHLRHASQKLQEMSLLSLENTTKTWHVHHLALSNSLVQKLWFSSIEAAHHLASQGKKSKFELMLWADLVFNSFRVHVQIELTCVCLSFFQNSSKSFFINFRNVCTYFLALKFKSLNFRLQFQTPLPKNEKLFFRSRFTRKMDGTATAIGGSFGYGDASNVVYICGCKVFFLVRKVRRDPIAHLTGHVACGVDNQIRPREPIRCKDCGYRIMYKKRTSKSNFFS